MMNEEFKNLEPEEEKHELTPEPLSRFSPVAVAFLALVGIFLLYQVGGAILTILIFGLDFQKADINATRLLTVGGQILLMLFPTLLLARFAYPHYITKMLRAHYPSWKEVGIFLLGFILLMPLLQNYIALQTFALDQLSSISPVLKKVMNFLDELDKILEKTYGDLLSAKSFFEGSFIIFMAAVIPAFCEETLFRGLVQKSFEQKFTPFLSILITSLFFALYHFNPYGLVALFALGFYFGFAAYQSNSILIPIILHFTNNFLSILIYITLGDDDLIGSSPKVAGSILTQLISFIILSVLFSAFIFYVKTNYTKFKTKKEEEV